MLTETLANYMYKYKILCQLTEASFLEPQYFVKRIILKYYSISDPNQVTKKIILYSTLTPEADLLIQKLLGSYTESSTLTLIKEEDYEVIHSQPTKIISHLKGKELSSSKKEIMDNLFKILRYLP